VALLFIVAATLFPYNFQFQPAPGRWALTLLFSEKRLNSEWDMLGNTVLFWPWGFAIAGWIARKKQLERSAALVAVFGTSLGLSCMIEVMQFYLPTRFPSWVDVACNTLGGTIGFLLFYIWNQANISLACVSYGVLAIAVSVASQRAIALSNWSREFPLVLGNELTGDRPWRGHVFELFIANRAISPVEVEENYRFGNIKRLLGNALICLYRFQRGPEYGDEMGRLPALVWNGPAGAVSDRASFNGAGWLETAGLARELTDEIVKTSQFSLGITLASEETEQEGPARIVSVSVDPMRRNFTLGQDADDLIFRLRTPFTGPNGGEPRLRVPNLFSTMETKHVVLTYDGTDLLAYVNGSLKPNRLTLTPGVAALGYFFDRRASRAMLYTIVYHVTAFIPFGLLLALSLHKSIDRFATRLGLAVLAVAIFGIAMETVVSTAGDRAWRWGNLPPGIGAAIGAVAFVEITAGFWQGRRHAGIFCCR
jgi:glycopeptide antibiotics resistance protein